MREWLEYVPVWLLLRVLGLLPRSAARAVGIAVGRLVYWLHPRLRRVGARNLELAFPEKSAGERARILRGMYATLGRQLADFAHLPRFTGENIADLVVHDGLEHYLAARDRGKGVLFATAHVGGWEIGSYGHALYGHPLQMVVRPLDNARLDRLVERYRTRSGNRTFPKEDFARGLLAATRDGQTVGILMDTNMTPPQGVFVPFFGRLACTASGLARVALRTDAAVVPGFTIWDEQLGKYRIRFDPALELVRTGNDEADAVANTALCTQVIEKYVRQHPEQWLWVHRRWKTRPPGEPPLY
ncbi:MAG TPA: lysophospholipid acyltransferase family protein [Terriglobales bacterium]|nr:lysophospholipid acyltransferase family protein [Terriglobales bacterium]